MAAVKDCPCFDGVDVLEYKWVALTVTTIGIFMVGLDARIVIIGLPQVASQLGADAEEAIWITQSYVLANTVLLLLIGRLSDVFGRVRIYSYGFAIFTIGSALTSLGVDPLTVIVFRAIQGFGAALIFSNSIAIVTDASPKNQLGLFVGINQIAYRAGAIFGLTISGLILSFLDWRALFYVNIPVGIFGTLWSRRRLKEIAMLDKNTKIDWPGFGAFAVFLLCLMTGLTVAAYGTFNPAIVYALFASSLIFLVAFILRERKTPSPLIDFRMFRIREVTGGILAVLFNVIAWAGMLLLLSFQFQLILGETPLEAGIRILPFEIAFLAVGPLSGTLSDKFGHSKFTLSGLLLGTISLLLFSTTNSSTPYSYFSFFMILMGVATGLFLAPNLRSVMAALPGQRRGIGSALVSLFLNVGLTVSLNFAVLVMSLTAPYDLLTGLISALNPLTITLPQKAIFMESIKNTYVALAIVNGIAILPSIFQLNRRRSSLPPVNVVTATAEPV